MTSDPVSPRAGLRSLTADLVKADPGLVRELAEAIAADVPLYRQPSPISSEMLLASAAEHIEYLVTGLVVEGVSAPRHVGSARARQGVPLSAVLDAFRAGSHFLWRRLVEHARSTGLVTESELVAVASEVWIMNDDYSNQLQEAYRVEQAALLVENERERAGYAYSILLGGIGGATTLWDAVEGLGLPRNGPIVVAALSWSRTDKETARSFERALRSGRRTSAWIVVGGLRLGLISGSSAEAVRDVLAEHRLRAGVSPVFSDYAAAPHAVRLARATLASASKGQALVFGESLIGSLVAGNPELAEETETVLDPILQLKSEDETRVLLLTLRAWFEAGGSYERVASGMYVHRNTVRNRIRRLETLTDRSLVDPRQSAEILVALTALDQRANEQTSR